MSEINTLCPICGNDSCANDDTLKHCGECVQDFPVKQTSKEYIENLEIMVLDQNPMKDATKLYIDRLVVYHREEIQRLKEENEKLKSQVRNKISIAVTQQQMNTLLKEEIEELQKTIRHTKRNQPG